MSDPDILRRGYARCAELTKMYGTTYYWGALLLPASQRRDVYTIYALCRLADDIVDEPDRVDASVPRDGTPEQRLNAFREWFYAALDAGGSSEPVLAAVVDSVQRRRTPRDCFDRFFHAMELDLTVSSWASWPDLRDGYMEGSAAVIGEMMLPVLEPRAPGSLGPARSLGLAFQLTNFIRDVAEDLDRGRVYLPADEFAHFGADPSLRRVTPEWTAFIAHQIRRNRELYSDAASGLPMLPRASRNCVGTALVLYSRILDRIEASGGDVFSGRVHVPDAEKARVLAGTLVRGPRLPDWMA